MRLVPIAAAASLIAIALFGFAMRGQAQKPARAADRPVLAELFTSQSCSSCPPADALLGELAKRPQVLALSFHVDYWDRLGWKDPYSLHAATLRQRHYAEILRAQVYTPQLVVDGEAETIGSDRESVEALLKARRSGVSATLHRESKGDIAIRIGDAQASGKIPTAEILFVTFDPVHKTAIHGGENGGRTLATYNDVRSLRVVADWHGEAVALDLTPQESEHGERSAVIVQSPNGAIWALAMMSPSDAE